MSLSEETPELILPPPDGAGWPTTSPGRLVVLDPATELGPAKAADETHQVEMCCDGSGRTADEHRAESDHKCCIDH